MSALILSDHYFDPEAGRISSYFSKLFILVGRASLQYCILDTDKNAFVALADFRPASPPKSRESFYSDVKQLVSEEEILQKKYPSVVIGIDTDIHTLVPTPLFDQDHDKKYLEFNFGLNGDEQIMSDRLEEIEAYNVYAIPSGLINFLQAHYKDAAIFHRTSALFRAVQHHQKAFTGQACMFLNVRDQFIDLISFNGPSLNYFNSYSCLSREDMLYYILNALDQLKLSPDQVHLVISGIFEDGSESHLMLEKYIQTVSYSGSLNSFDYSPLLKQLPLHRYQEIYALALCGL